MRLLKLGKQRRVLVLGPSQGDPLGRGHFEDRGLCLRADLHPFILLGVRWWHAGAMVFIGPVCITLHRDR